MRLYNPIAAEAIPGVWQPKLVGMELSGKEFETMDRLCCQGLIWALHTAGPKRKELIKQAQAEIFNARDVSSPSEGEMPAHRIVAPNVRVAMLHNLAEHGRLVQAAGGQPSMSEFDIDGQRKVFGHEFTVRRGLAVAAATGVIVYGDGIQRNYDAYNADPDDPGIKLIANLEQSEYALNRLHDLVEEPPIQWDHDA